ncbi:MAG TPA: hypothetical protein DD490_21835 [Acidobacteria bacterium]|nr:hypothetical protein [Acidobacteriota bacterium]
MVTGEPVEGTWYDRTLARSLRLRRETPKPGEVDVRQTVSLSPLPCWKHLAPEVYRSRVADLLRGIEEAAALERKKKGIEPLGAAAILKQEPEARPEHLDRSPAPFIHAATKRVRKELREAYGWFLAAFREAADKLKKGDRAAPFPPGSFPPHLPFVPA